MTRNITNNFVIEFLASITWLSMYCHAKYINQIGVILNARLENWPFALLINIPKLRQRIKNKIQKDNVLKWCASCLMIF